MQEAEHNTKYFFNLEKCNAKAKCMQQTHRHDGSVMNNQQEVLVLQSQFYQKLYSSNCSISCNIQGPMK